jgi:predicted DNA-binding protein (UPF0251 family)
MTPEPKISLTWEERQALPVIQKLLKRKPEAAALLMQGVSKAGAVSLLVQAKKEISDLHTMSRAMVAAAGVIVQMDKAEETP